MSRPRDGGGCGLWVVGCHKTSTHNSQSAIHNDQRGSILLYVVWAIGLLSLFTVSVSAQAMFALDVTERLSKQLRAAYLAKSALQYAWLALHRDPTPTVDGLAERWSDAPDIFQTHQLAGGIFTVAAREPDGSRVRYGLTDEERSLSLNGAPEEVLQRFFEFMGVSRYEAAELASAIEDWRDPDDDQRPLGAERFYYRSLGQPYDCKNGPFENLEELLLVRGMTPSLYRAAAPYLTVYGSGRLNLNTAGPTALKALGLSQAGVGGLLSFRAGEDGREGTADDRLLVSVDGIESQLGASLPAEDLARLAQLARDKALGVHADDVRLEIRAETSGPSSRASVVCVINRAGMVKLWSEQ